MFALRILDAIFKKYRLEITYAEEGNMNITHFISQLLEAPVFYFFYNLFITLNFIGNN